MFLSIPSKEDLKMMIFLTKPKYYIPIKGEYRLLHMNSQIAVEMGYDPSRIIILDNEFKLPLLKIVN